MAKDNRFWVLTYDEFDHYDDLIKSAKAGELACLVDEEAGGIIAYIIDSPENRPAELAAALESARRK